MPQEGCTSWHEPWCVFRRDGMLRLPFLSCSTCASGTAWRPLCRDLRIDGSSAANRGSWCLLIAPSSKSTSSCTSHSNFASSPSSWLRPSHRHPSHHPAHRNLVSLNPNSKVRKVSDQNEIPTTYNSYKAIAQRLSDSGEQHSCSIFDGHSMDGWTPTLLASSHLFLHCSSVACGCACLHWRCRSIASDCFWVIASEVYYFSLINWFCYYSIWR